MLMELHGIPISINDTIKHFDIEICKDGNRKYYQITSESYSLKVFENLVAVTGNMPDEWLIPVVRKLEQISAYPESFVQKEIEMEESL